MNVVRLLNFLQKIIDKTFNYVGMYIQLIFLYMQSTLEKTEKTINLWGVVDSGKNRKNNQPVRHSQLRKKQKKQSTCEAQSTPKKTEKTINLWWLSRKNRKNNQPVRHSQLQKKQKNQSTCEAWSTLEHLRCHQKHAPGCIQRLAWWWWLWITLQKNRKNNQPVRCGLLWKKRQPVRCGQLQSTCIVIKSMHLAAFRDWHDDDNSRWLSRKIEKQSTCEVQLTLEKTEKTINLWGMVNSKKNRKNSQPVRHGRLWSTCIIIESIHLAAFGDWHCDDDSGRLSRKNRKINQPVSRSGLQKKKKKQLTCEVWSTSEKIEKTINLSPSNASGCIWRPAWWQRLWRMTPEHLWCCWLWRKKEKQLTCEVQKDCQLCRPKHAPAFRDQHDGKDSRWL